MCRCSFPLARSEIQWKKAASDDWFVSVEESHLAQRLIGFALAAHRSPGCPRSVRPSQYARLTSLFRNER